jgi:hypothetical protein
MTLILDNYFGLSVFLARYLSALTGISNFLLHTFSVLQAELFASLFSM